MSGSANIAAHLDEMARQRPDQIAVIDSRTEAQVTYSQLNANSNRVANQLAQRGVQPGDRVALLLRPSIKSFEYVFALFRFGTIPVVVDPGIGIKNMGRCLTEAEPRVIIGGAKAQLASRLLGWAKRTLEIRINPRSLPPTQSTSVLLANVRSDDMAAILFTSGSTGPPKGAVYTHGMFQEQVRVLREVFAIEPGEVDLCTFPLFALFAPALGMTSIIPDMDPTRPAKANPDKIRQAVVKYRATNLFGSPALVKVLTQAARSETQSTLPTLKRIISAGAPVPWTLVMEASNLLLTDNNQVFTPYGATEALPVAVTGSNDIGTVAMSKSGQCGTSIRTAQGGGICVGRAVGRTEVVIIPISDEPIVNWSSVSPLPVNQIGEIVVRGPVVSRTYFNRPEATDLAKISDSAHGTFWHRMGDVGYLDETSRLWFCGRKSHRVITPNSTLFTIPCESIFNYNPDCSKHIARTALVGVMGRPVICIEVAGRPAANEIEEMKRNMLDVAGRYAHMKSIRDFLVYPGSFPVDIRHNAKINREKLAVWAARQLR